MRSSRNNVDDIRDYFNLIEEAAVVGVASHGVAGLREEGEGQKTRPAEKRLKNKHNESSPPS